jgi:MFS family permease
LPVNRRGRFLGARATLATLVGVLTVLGLGRVMDLTHNRAFLGFTIVFFGIVLCRFISLLLLWRVHDPPLPKHVAKGPGFREMMRSMMKSDLGRFMFLNFFFNLACTVGGPFFTVLILKDLQFSYTTFILLQMVSACSAMIGLQVWGRIADRAGNARILHIVVPVIGIVAISWVFHQSVLYLAFVHMAGGFVWAGYNVSSLNYALETSSDEERTKLVGYYAAFAGVGIFIGSLTGGIIAPYVPKIFAYSTLTLIFISGLLRLGTGIAMLVMVREVRKLEPSVHPRGLMRLPSSLLHLGRRQE